MNAIHSRSGNALRVVLPLLLVAATLSTGAWSQADDDKDPRPAAATPNASGESAVRRAHGGGGVVSDQPSTGGNANRNDSRRNDSNRSDRNRYSPPVSSNFRNYSDGYQRYGFRGEPYYFRSGIWYRNSSLGYTSVRPPRGLLIYSLPPFYNTRWYGGVPYYYSYDTYYLWDPVQRGYVVTDPPGASVTTAPEEPLEDSDDLYVYPMQNQSSEQQATDRYECYRWAADQTGFDLTQPAGGVTSASEDRRTAYHRAETACLTGRGYSVK